MKPLQLSALLVHCLRVLGNTEKVIFLGPDNLHVPHQHPTLDDLQLQALSPQQSSLRTYVQAVFPSESSPFGESSWFLLQSLYESQRYEVRICWAATQPTAFRIETYSLPEVFATPELISSLAQYSQTRQAGLSDANRPTTSKSLNPLPSPSYFSSILFLRVFAAADYYTMNKTLMRHVPPVHVDIILDPYLLNIFPQSLLPTAVYLIFLAIGSWKLAGYVNSCIQQMSPLRVGWTKKTL